MNNGFSLSTAYSFFLSLSLYLFSQGNANDLFPTAVCRIYSYPGQAVITSSTRYADVCLWSDVNAEPLNKAISISFLAGRSSWPAPLSRLTSPHPLATLLPAHTGSTWCQLSIFTVYAALVDSPPRVGQQIDTVVGSDKKAEVTQTSIGSGDSRRSENRRLSDPDTVLLLVVRIWSISVFIGEWGKWENGGLGEFFFPRISSLFIWLGGRRQPWKGESWLVSRIMTEPTYDVTCSSLLLLYFPCCCTLYIQPSHIQD